MSLDMKAVEGIVALLGAELRSIGDSTRCAHCAKDPKHLMIFDNGDPRCKHVWLACKNHALECRKWNKYNTRIL